MTLTTTVATPKVAIVGGGCAGLSLAAALASRPFAVEVFEPRQRYCNDRTFCYWEVEPHPYSQLASPRWWRWLVRAGGRTAVASSRRYPYCHLPAERFYTAALAAIDRSDNVALRLGCRVEVLAASPQGVALTTSQGSHRFDWAFDSRPPSSAALSWGLWQHFLGQVIETSNDCFDPTTVVLMDFDAPQTAGIHFFYLLPLTSRRALVEATYFSPQPLTADHYRRDIASYCQRRYGLGASDYTVISEEQGQIPMVSKISRASASSQVVAIGTAGGAIKTSSGYGFAFIQRLTPKLVAALERSPTPANPAGAAPHPRLATVLDRIFLSYLCRHPAQVPKLMLALFERVESDALVRFLMERATLADYCAVMAAMPTWAFSLEALRAPQRWLGGR